MKNHKLGFAGNIAKFFIRSKLTPMIVIVSLLLGLVAIFMTPKEEEPQISVPLIDINTKIPGYSAKEVERKITEVIESAVWGIEGVEYVYSTSQNQMSLVTVRFKVGETMEPSLVKVYQKIQTIKNLLPTKASAPQVDSYTIDDVPFLVVTFSSSKQSPLALRTTIAPFARELSSTPNLAKVEVIGGSKRNIRVITDPIKLSRHGVNLTQLAQAIENNDAIALTGKNWSSTNVFDVEVGQRLDNIDQLKNISVTQSGGQIIRLNDVADIIDGPEEFTHYSSLQTKDAPPENAASLVFTKRKGANIVDLSDQLLSRLKILKKNLSPDIKMSVVRNYGETANKKFSDLMSHLLLATLSVTVLIAIAMGIRPALVVAIAIPVTLSLTLAIYYFLGYTLNRVTLFALVFSIGILVDDAIVVVENIQRHLSKAKTQLYKYIINAVSEVGNPTILATFTVIAAILPMAFVRGLMGPYMRPIPIGASFAMIFSLLVAFIVTPWAALKLLQLSSNEEVHNKSSKLDQVYKKIMSLLLERKFFTFLFFLIIFLFFTISMSLIYFKIVKVKMLPFDNKNEFQVLIDYPNTTPLSQNVFATESLIKELIDNPNVTAIQSFSGESAPFSFSGMIKHTFLRKADYLADLHIVFTDKDDRKKSSHEIIESLRPIIQNFAIRSNAVTKVLEIPPGPPVIATMMAEVYGPDDLSRHKTAQTIQEIFKKEPSVVDLDTSLRLARPRQFYQFNQATSGLLGINSQSVVDIGRLLFSENTLTTLSDISAPENVNINLSVAQAFRSSEVPFLHLEIPTHVSGVVPLENSLNPSIEINTEIRHRKNLKPVTYVMSELSGSEEAPVYGILKIAPHIHVPLQTAEVPQNTSKPIVKWDGEWFITYEVFRDLGGAFAIVMVLIYILVLGWFRSFLVPLVIMAPIPISLIGILPGHAILQSYFTATSMIGFIAGAGIIVRNSIILVDFIEKEIISGLDLQTAVINAGVLRFRPMLLTASAVIVGSSVMLSDPIFQGLAVSLIFGEIAGTLMSRFAVPVLYYWIIGHSRVKSIRDELNQNIA